MSVVRTLTQNKTANHLESCFSIRNACRIPQKVVNTFFIGGLFKKSKTVQKVRFSVENCSLAQISMFVFETAFLH
jgi:hypothetical protein